MRPLWSIDPKEHPICPLPALQGRGEAPATQPAQRPPQGNKIRPMMRTCSTSLIQGRCEDCGYTKALTRAILQQGRNLCRKCWKAFTMRVDAEQRRGRGKRGEVILKNNYSS